MVSVSEVILSARCPNCGEWRHHFDLGFGACGGKYCTTLYGVCRQCAERHEEYVRAMDAISDPRASGNPSSPSTENGQ
jgi:hypothetical protein